jgi:methyl-accepting chemotaxis protein
MSPGDTRGSLRQGLARAMLLTTGGSLVASLLALVGLQVVLAPRDVEQRLGGMGDVIALYSMPAVEFDDPEAGHEALSALAAIPEASFGLLLRPNGDVFASWGEVPQGLSGAALAAQPGLTLSASHADWTRSLEHDGRLLGTLVIRARLSALFSRILATTAILVGICLGALVVAFLIATRLRENLARPLAELAASAEALAAGDLSGSVRVERDDELGALAQSFERMAESLRGLLSQASTSTAALSGEAGRLAEAGASMSEEARRQEGAAAATADSIGRLESSLGEVSATARSLADGAAESNAAMTEIDTSVAQAARDIERLFDTADGAASSVVQMSAAVRQIAANAVQLARATDATLGSMRELQGSLRGVEGQARLSHGSTGAAAESAQKGEAAVEATIASMARIEESFGALEKIVADLAERSKAIESVLEVIDEVVDQTNLLSLNAAIIASQAGKEGKAFSVVASEIKSLAQRTSASTREISASVASVLRGVEQAVAATAAGGERVREGAHRSTEAGQALREIREVAARASQASDAILGATASQVRGVEGVATELDRVKALVDQIAAATREQGNASSEIQRGAESLRELAESLKRSTANQTHQSRLTSQAVDRVAAAAAQIRDATEGQRREVGQILEAAEVFRDASIESARRAESVQSTVQALRQRSTALESEIGRFTGVA